MCVVSAILASSVGTAIASSIASAATAVGSGLASVGIGTGISASTAATIGSISTAGLVGGTIGAGTGMATSAITGGNIGKGALIGGLTGGVLSGVGEGVQIAGGIPIPGTDYTIGGGGSNLYAQTLDKMGGMPVADPSVVGMVDQAGNRLPAPLLDATNATPEQASAEMFRQLGYNAQEAKTLAIQGSMGVPLDPSVTITEKGSALGAVGNTASSLGKSVAADVFTPGNLLRVGSAAVQVYSGIKQADLIKQDAENTMEMAEMEAGVHEMEASAAAAEARLHRVRAANEEKIAGYEKEGILKQKHQMAGKARAAAAGNGVLLEDRAESAPAMYEQDLAGEAAYEIDKVNMNTRTKQLTHLMNASAAAANAGIARQKAAMSRVRGLQAKQASNLKSTSAIISGISGGLMSAGSIFA